MTHNEAYAILGINKNVPKSQIKAAFRKKAKHVHPDINSSKNAHESFIKLTEAYDILINQRAPKATTAKPTTHTSPVDPFVKYAKVYRAPTDPEEYREWIIVAKARAKKVAQKEYELMLEDIKLMKKVGRIIATISLFSLLLSLFCIYDLHMTENNRTEIIQKKVDLIDGSYYVVTDHTKFQIGIRDVQRSDYFDDSIRVEKTGVMGIYKNIYFYIQGESLEYAFYDDYYYGIAGGTYIGLIISVLGLVFRKRTYGPIVAIFIFGFLIQIGSFLTILFAQVL